tara:strand:+ start:65994 stop:66359 length:366 start_codon:yes stop_codon:yes gene_type:complete
MMCCPLAYGEGSNDHPDIAPPGFEEFLENNKDKSFKLRVPIRKDRKPTMHEVENGSEKEKKLKAAMYKLKSKCNLRNKPTEKSAVLNVLPSNRSIWVEHHDIFWGKVYRKKGIAFIHRSCL